MPRLVRLCIGYLPDAVLPPERPKALCSSAAQPAHSANASPHAALATSGDLAARAADALPLGRRADGESVKNLSYLNHHG